MKFYTSARAKLNSDSVVALGCFDGVHIGHSKIISSAVSVANEKSLTSVVWSFQSPPKSVLMGQSDSANLTSLAEKKAIMRSLSVDVFVSVKFNDKIARLSPREFFEDILINHLNAKHIFCGFNYRFGHKGIGDTAILQELCDEFGVTLTVLDEVKVNGNTVSSSAIRTYLANGELELAEQMLGRPFFLRGRVVDGQHLGRTFGFPTINQDVPSDKASVKNGVYLTRVKIGRTVKYGVTNIGMRPTVNGVKPVCETHILDFNGNLYGKILNVEFVKFLRPERKFGSLDELSTQIKIDAERARELAKNL